MDTTPRVTGSGKNTVTLRIPYSGSLNFTYDAFNRVQYIYVNDIPPCVNPPSCTVENPLSNEYQVTYDGNGNLI